MGIFTLNKNQILFEKKFSQFFSKESKYIQKIFEVKNNGDVKW